MAPGDPVTNTPEIETPCATPKMQTPCRSICRLDDRDMCVGCGRTLQEIADWTTLTDAERVRLMERLSSRSPSLDTETQVPTVQTG